MSAFASGCNATQPYIMTYYSFSGVLSFSSPSSFSSTGLPCETVVRTLEELPCTSVHVLDVRVPCENSGQRIPLPGPMQRLYNDGRSLFSISSFSCIFSRAFNLLRLCRYTADAVVYPDVHVIEPNVLI